jgi:hypothetical protein
VLAGFASDLLALFAASPSASPAPAPPAGSGGQTGGAEDPEAWADLLLDSPEARPVKSLSLGGRDRERERDREICDVLPDIGTLERPEELTRRPPYWMVVKQLGAGKVQVQCSHQGSLLVLEGYLKKWARHSTDFTNRVSLSSPFLSFLGISSCCGRRKKRNRKKDSESRNTTLWIYVQDRLH